MDIENAELQPISGLPAATTFVGLFTIGTDSQNRSVKVPLAAVVNPPYIGNNGHWYVWSMSSGGYVDSGNVAKGATGMSAYDYAVEVLGFVGTIEEWYESMKGEALTWDDLTPAQKAALKGEPGADGLGVSTCTVAYCVTEDDSATIPAVTWSESMPTVPVGHWLWTRFEMRFTDNSVVTFYTKSRHSANGKSAYDLAVEGGYQGTEQQFAAMLAGLGTENVWLTEEEWDALQVKDPNKTYNIYEEV